MSINHNRIKVSDLEKNQPNKILTTNNDGELEFSNISDIQVDSYNALDYTQEGKALDARQGKILKDLINNINALLASDNVNLNTVQKLVDAIETVQTSLTTMLVNDLTTGGTTKALTAEMGKTLQTNKVDKVAGERLINATEIAKLSGSINVTTTTKTILSTALTTQNVAGFVTYINTLNPVLIVGSNEIVKYTTSDTGRVFQLNLRGRSFGVGQSAITATDVNEITDFLNKDIRLSNYPSTRNDGPSTTNKVLAPDLNGNLKLYTIATFPAPFLSESTPDTILPSTTTNFTLKGAFFTPTMTVSIAGQTVNYITFVSDNLIKVNITTSATEGSYTMTLNNGSSATYPNALLIVLGRVYQPTESEWTGLVASPNVSEIGSMKSTAVSVLQSGIWKTIPPNIDFRIQLSGEDSPLFNSNHDSQDFGGNLRLLKASDNSYLWIIAIRKAAGTGNQIRVKNYLGGDNGDNNGAAQGLANGKIITLERKSGFWKLYVNFVLTYSFTETINEEMYIQCLVKNQELKNIKYIELNT
ncbi:IPT/TIG domain-containing protein [Flavobacterium geliluteum]|uniref:IPT/TIG domain-containing protein n=1 Tax=Flavobacterium geliluteum TaxID=2816120 RepID=A0A941AV74_9FLAO|nr:IPT/TIG domain-containing protein [Flavobacterium geliluteum]MBP4136959.1 IPT/TIG domain-containing protein [Flavobacterium geliluteum]